MGLGPAHTVSLAKARDDARAARVMMQDGLDPLSERRKQMSRNLESLTFRDCADAFIEAHRDSWRNPKHKAQWQSTLETYVFPRFGNLPIEEVDTACVMRALEPIWHTKTETASRVRGRIERVLDWARARGYRDGENPARWRGHLDKLLPARSKVQVVKHHAALAWGEIPSFMAAVRAREGIAARALEFAILTAARSGEVRGMTWEEVDLTAGVWTVPAERMKARREHRVPLSKRAVTILQDIRPRGHGVLVFPGL